MPEPHLPTRSQVNPDARSSGAVQAHAILVVTAYLEAQEETGLPVWFTDLELTKAERVAMGDEGSRLGSDTTDLISVLFSTPIGFPEPQLSHEAYWHCCIDG